MERETQLLGIYVHVPFCRQRCSYCHFHIKVFHPRTDRAPFYRAWYEAVTRELLSYAAELGGRVVSSIFYGGGTPSQLPLHYLEGLQTTLAGSFDLDPDCEISMEVNPEDGSPQFLKRLPELGVNRVSFGVQTFDGKGLVAANRAHDAAAALAVFEGAEGFAKGRSLDLILGLPFQNQASLRHDLAMITRLAPEHLSLYMLERDLPTPLDKTGRAADLPGDDHLANFYEYAADYLKTAGYEHYEISSFCRPGMACRHNLTYWLCGDYLGIGPAAHGRIGRCYTANEALLAGYLARVGAVGRGVGSIDLWSRERLRQERLIQGLRLSRGVPSAWLAPGERTALGACFEAGLLREDAGRLNLTRKGRLLSNEVFTVFVA